MKAEQLLLMATARGINLDLGRPKRDAPSMVTRTNGELTARGTPTRSARPPEWSPREIGMAAQGMPDVSWRALCWVIGDEPRSRVYLKGALESYAADLSERECWPDRMPRGYCGDCGCARDAMRYVEDMCALAVIEIAKPSLYSSEARRAEFFAVQEHTWTRHLSRRYQPLFERANGWYSEGVRYIQRRLNESQREEFAQESA